MVTVFKTKSSSKLAKAIATQLLAAVGTPRGIDCMSTGDHIPGCTNYNKVVTINPSATGAHYIAYGYYYILCYDKVTEEEYVAVHDTSNSKLVGTIERPEDMEVLIRGAEATD